MSLYTHYEAAQQQLDGNDLFVVRALTLIHQSMLKKANSGMKPAFPFDMQYYYDSLIRSLACDYDHVVEPVEPSLPSVSAVNIPELSEPRWQETHFVQTGKALRFIELVKRESKQGGSPFDLSFACGIAADAFNEASLVLVEDGVGKRVERSGDEFDDWLQGFNSAEGSQ